MIVEKLIQKYKNSIENGYMALEIIDFETKEKLYVEDCNVAFEVMPLEKLNKRKVEKVRFIPNFYFSKVTLAIYVAKKHILVIHVAKK